MYCKVLNNFTIKFDFASRGLKKYQFELFINFKKIVCRLVVGFSPPVALDP